MIALATDQAEKMLREGNAPTQVVLHYLKLGATRERLEQEMIEKQKELLDAKIASLEAQQGREELYEKAIKAFISYQSSSRDPEDIGV